MRAIVLLFGVGLGAGAAVLEGQQVSGVVLEHESGRRLAAVEVSVLSGSTIEGRALTDSAGRFAVALQHGGRYKLRATLIGYRSVTSEPFEVAGGEAVRTELLLSVAAIPLDPLRVTARGPLESAYLASMGFYERQRAGTGHFLARTEIEKRHAVVLSDVLSSVPGVKLLRADRGAQKRSEVTFSRGMSSVRQCMPAIFMDGALARAGGPIRPNEVPLDEWINPRDIEGIELYHGAAATPAIFNQQAQCGVVAIWTKKQK
jgi:hypothetical protein